MNMKLNRMSKSVLIVLLVFFGFNMSAQNKNARAAFEVDGVCTMCKERIEKAAIRTKGVKSATWNINTHMLSVIYDERRTDLKTINQNVAEVGHDTHEIKATDEAYSKIHSCCKYRDEEVIKEHE